VHLISNILDFLSTHARRHKKNEHRCVGGALTVPTSHRTAPGTLIRMCNATRRAAPHIPDTVLFALLTLLVVPGDCRVTARARAIVRRPARRVQEVGNTPSVTEMRDVAPTSVPGTMFYWPPKRPVVLTRQHAPRGIPR